MPCERTTRSTVHAIAIRTRLAYSHAEQRLPARADACCSRSGDRAHAASGCELVRSPLGRGVRQRCRERGAVCATVLGLLPTALAACDAHDRPKRAEAEQGLEAEVDERHARDHPHRHPLAEEAAEFDDPDDACEHLQQDDVHGREAEKGREHRQLQEQHRERDQRHAADEQAVEQGLGERHQRRAAVVAGRGSCATRLWRAPGGSPAPIACVDARALPTECGVSSRVTQRLS